MPTDLSLKKKDMNGVETGRPFSPAVFQSVLKNFTPDVPNKISGRPRFVFKHTSPISTHYPDPGLVTISAYTFYFSMHLLALFG